MIQRPVNRRTLLSRTAIAAAATTLPGFAHAANSSLSEHRIDRVEFRTVSVPWPRQVGRNSSKGVHGHGPTRVRVCVLHTNHGATGWGQTQGKTGKPEQLLELLKGKSVAELIDPTTGIRSEKYHAIDIPLHDLAGIILDQPVWAMSGAEKPHLTKVYSGMIYFDDLDPIDNPAGIDKVLENCRWDYGYGYRQFKVKIGRGNKWMPAKAGLERDIDVVNAIHKAFPDVDILVDGNNGFTVETMIGFLEGIADVPLFWIEEPFHETVADWTARPGLIFQSSKNFKRTTRSTSAWKTSAATDSPAGAGKCRDSPSKALAFHRTPGARLSRPSTPHTSLAPMATLPPSKALPPKEVTSTSVKTESSMLVSNPPTNPASASPSHLGLRHHAGW